MEEKWKDIFEGRYSVSNQGRVRSNLVFGGKIIKGHTLTGGYLGFKFTMAPGRANRTTKNLHRLIALAWVENPSNHPHVNHKDGNKQNNHPSNLEFTTVRGNSSHAVENGLLLRGTLLSVMNTKEFKSLCPSCKALLVKAIQPKLNPKGVERALAIE